MTESKSNIVLREDQIVLQKFFIQDLEDSSQEENITYQYQDRQLILQKNDYLLALLKSLTILILIIIFYFSATHRTQTTSKRQESQQIFKIQNTQSNQNQSGNLIYTQDLQSKKLIQILKSFTYYDIRHFYKKANLIDPFNIYLFAEKNQQKDRPLIFKEMTYKDLIKNIDTRLEQIKNNGNLVIQQLLQNVNKQKAGLVFFNYQLYLNPKNKNYLQAQFDHLNNHYNIGNYGSQLPLCIVLVGKNQLKSLIKSYDSIKRQNYTNYRVVHINDNSKDLTIKKTINYLNMNFQLKKRVTLIGNNYQRNKLYSRNLGVTKFCNDGQIVVELDEGEQFIGNQVFQLINTIYQKGNIVQNQKHQVWMLYIHSIGSSGQYSPYITSKYQQSSFMKERIKFPIIKHLKTYIRNLYNKIDKSQMKDSLIPNQIQFYAQRQDAFMQYGMIEMSRPYKIVFLSQFAFFSNQSQEQQSNLQKQYAELVVKIMKSYHQIKNLSQTPTRVYENRLKIHQLQMIRDQKRSQIKIKLYTLYYLIVDQYKKQLRKIQKIQGRQVYNRQNENKTLGQQSQFQTDVSGIIFQNIIPDFSYNKYGIQSDIQVGSMYDYMNLNKVINMQDLKLKLANSLAHQVLSFKQNQHLSKQIQLLKYQYFKSKQEIEQYIKTAATITPERQKVQNDFEYHLGSGLSRLNIEKKFLQLQYYYANKKYNIQSSKQENSFCIYSSGYNIYSKGNYIKYFKSIQKLNYSNYHIVYVDDYSDDQSAYKTYQYLSHGNLSIKNKIKIIRNLQHIGILANMHIHIEKYCNPDDIVVITDADDCIVGTQTLHILNKKYLNPEIWVLYSKFLMNSQVNNTFYRSTSSFPISVHLPQYRTTLQYWVTSHLRTFRRKVQSLIPLTHFIQFKYDEETKIVFPQYYQTSADRCQVYSNLQISGRDRIHFLTQYLYLYLTNQPIRCRMVRQVQQEFKCRLKFPLRRVNTLNDQVQYDPRYNIQKKLLQKLGEYHEKKIDCIKYNEKQ